MQGQFPRFFPRHFDVRIAYWVLDLELRAVGEGESALVDLRKSLRVHDFLRFQFLNKVLTNLQNVFLIVVVGLGDPYLILHGLEPEHEVVQNVKHLLVGYESEQILSLLAQALAVVNIARR